MSLFMLHHSDSNCRLFQNAEQDHVWKALHESAPHFALHHPLAPRRRRDSKYLTLKFVNELISQSGESFIVIVPNLF